MGLLDKRAEDVALGDREGELVAEAERDALADAVLRGVTVAHEDGVAVTRGLALTDDEARAEAEVFADRVGESDWDADAVAVEDTVLVFEESIVAVASSVGVPVSAALSDCAELNDATNDRVGGAVTVRDGGAESVAVASAEGDGDSVANGAVGEAEPVTDALLLSVARDVKLRVALLVETGGSDAEGDTEEERLTLLDFEGDADDDALREARLESNADRDDVCEGVIVGKNGVEDGLAIESAVCVAAAAEVVGVTVGAKTVPENDTTDLLDTLVLGDTLKESAGLNDADTVGVTDPEAIDDCDSDADALGDLLSKLLLEGDSDEFGESLAAPEGVNMGE